MARFAVWSSVLLSSIGIILIAVCLGTNNWVSRKRETFSVTEGLFFRCSWDVHSNNATHERCHRLYYNFKDFPALYIAILSLMFGACLFQLLTFLVSMLNFCMESSPAKAICTLEILTFMCAVGGLSTYVRFYDNKYYRLDWSYIVGWVGVCFISIGLVFIIVGIERKRQSY
ncbi:uncharacterized protein LOC135688008 [Rhopilema esculentum]|uniref:uncharacterized protein LOC135688008 n=1 Tax=Rhopilema esculentum TaxID=499914 RepID=UPI0031D2810A